MPGIEFIKPKSFTAGIEPQGWLPRSDHLANEIVAACQAMFSLMCWLSDMQTGRGDLGYLSRQTICRLMISGSSNMGSGSNHAARAARRFKTR